MSSVEVQVATKPADGNIAVRVALRLTSRELGRVFVRGDVLIHLQDDARAYGALQQSVALCDEYGFERLSSHNRMLLAYLAGKKGDEKAIDHLETGIRYAESNAYMWDVISGRYLRAELLKYRGRTAEAVKEFTELRELAKANGHRMVADDCAAALQSIAK